MSTNENNRSSSEYSADARFEIKSLPDSNGRQRFSVVYQVGSSRCTEEHDDDNLDKWVRIWKARGYTVVLSSDHAVKP